VDRRANHQAERIDDDVTFAAFDLLAGVVTARPAALGGFHRLAVE
jgi:hypothetical protein